MFDALLKIGGSLVQHPGLRQLAAAWSELAQTYRLLVLPGGGPFADAVRAADERFQLGDSTAHWMAILAMDQYAYLLATLCPRAVLGHEPESLALASAEGRLSILAPSRLLQHRDPLPHRWEVTSDSIAAWLAAETGIQRLVLLKSVAGLSTLEPDNTERLVKNASPHALAELGLVDAYFAQTLSPATTCWLIDGRRPERLSQLLAEGQTIGSQVCGK